MSSLHERIEKVQEEIQEIGKKKGWDTKNISLLAATKYASADEIHEAVKAGIQHIGENRIQDAIKKLKTMTLPVKKHFIGHLQTNKVKEAVHYFDIIESIDSLKLAEAVNKEAEKQGKKIELLLEVNIAHDPKKFGFTKEEVESAVARVASQEWTRLKGLMAIVPFFENIEKTRPYFRSMKELFDTLRHKYPELETLSMGMSHDYHIALEEGATEIRIGSLLFK